MTVKTIAFAIGISAFAGLAAAFIWVAVDSWITDRRLARQDEKARRLVAEARTADEERRLVAEEARLAAANLCASGVMCDYCALNPATCGHATKATDNNEGDERK